MRFFWVFSFLVINTLTPISFAQEIDVVFEEISEGMPSSEVHDVFQDTLGYMWFATDRGICKYDGDKFLTFETSSFFKSKVVYKFFKQNNTKIWVATGKRRIYWFNPYEDKILFHEHPANNTLETIQLNSNYERFVSHMDFINNDIIITSRLAPGYIRINSKNECRLIDSEFFGFRQNSNTSNYVLKKIGNQSYYQIEVSTSPTSTIQLNPKTKINLANEYFIRQNHSFGVSSQLKTNEGEYIGFANFLIHQKNGKSAFIELPSIVLSLAEFENSILVGTYNGIFRVSSDLKIEEHYLPEYSITKILKDYTGKFWISTLQSGVLLVQDFNTHQVRFPFFFSITGVQVSHKKLILFDSSKNKMVVYNEGLEHQGNYENVFLDKYRIKLGNKDLISQLSLNQKDNYSHNKLSKETGIYYYLTEQGANLNYYVFGGKIWTKSGNSLTLVYKSKTPNRLNLCVQIDIKTLLVGTDYGLYYFDLPTKKMSPKPIQNSNGLNFNDFVKLKKNLVFATNQGLYKFTNGKLSRISQSANDDFTGIFKVDENHLWAYSDKQLFSITIKEKLIVVSPFYFNFGLQNIRIVSLALFGDKLWVATKSGLFIADPKLSTKNRSHLDFRFVLDSVRVNNEKVTYSSSIHAHSEDKISFFFNTICYDHTHSNELQYSTDGKTWYETNKHSLVLSNLPFGNNILKIRVSENPKKIVLQLPIYIERFYYQTLWFKILFSLIVFISGTWLFYKILKAQERKRTKELEKLTLELKLLTSKMNPHFAFNTINSIQHFILKNDKKEAIKYLSDFGLLMRKSLDFSMEETISIDQEKEFIELYVELENKRFNANFELEFELKNPALLATKKIPSMLIQPLVENVILHAKYAENERKIIKISIRFDNGFFLIKVIDFGIGVQSIAELKSHKSYGIDIIKSRIKLYNGKDYTEDDLTITSTLSTPKKGTTITIKLKSWTQSS